jgi:hypothetical protein
MRVSARRLADRTHLRTVAIAVSPMPDGFQLFCPARHIISRFVAIELCETACLSALFFKKKSQMGSIRVLWDI